jgi:diguanylate cyclase (GGDEF)-like protein
VLAVLCRAGRLPARARRARRGLADWQIWTLGEPLRSYLLVTTLVAAALFALTAAHTHWRPEQGVVFAGLLCCGAVAIESTRAVKEPQGTAVRDLQAVWYLAIAVVLPPAYAFLAPWVLMAYKLWRAPRLMVYRRVFSHGVLSLTVGCASLVFHLVPKTVAGPVPGSGRHILTWTLVVAACAGLCWLINVLLLLGAIRLADPEVRIRDIVGSRESAAADAIEASVGVFGALVIAISPVLMVLVLPTVIMQRRYLMHLQLAAQARLDVTTGLLNAFTWQREAAAEFARALRTGTPLAVAKVDIDDFKSVNDSAGKLVSDQVLRGVGGMLREQIRGGDLLGRLGREEFAILLPCTDWAEARRISERLRDHIAGEPIAIESGAQAGFVFRLTVSIGVAVLTESRRALAELIGAADKALERAKSTGWNKVYVLADGTADTAGQSA